MSIRWPPRRIGSNSRAVAVEQRSLTAGRLATQSGKLGFRNAIPIAPLLTIDKRRRSVDIAVEAVDVVREFVDHEVVSRPAFFVADDFGPGKHDRAVLPGFAEAWIAGAQRHPRFKTGMRQVAPPG